MDEFDDIVQTLRSESESTNNDAIRKTYGFWEDEDTTPDADLYYRTLRLYTQTLNLTPEDFMRDYSQLGKRSLYLAVIEKKLLATPVPTQEVDDFLRQIYPLKGHHQGIYNELRIKQHHWLGSSESYQRTYANIKKQLSLETQEVDLANPTLKFIGSGYVTNENQFVSQVLCTLKRIASYGTEDCESARQLLEGLRAHDTDFVSTLDTAVELVKQHPDAITTNVSLQLLYDGAGKVRERDLMQIERVRLDAILKEYARESQITNAFVKELSRQTGRPVLLWANQRGAIVATRSIDATLNQLPKEKRRGFESRIRMRQGQSQCPELATLLEYNAAMTSKELSWAVLMMEGKIPSSASDELGTFFGAIDHLNEYAKRVAPLLDSVEPIVVFADRSPAYRFPLAANRFQLFMEEQFPKYAVTGVRAHNSGVDGRRDGIHGNMPVVNGGIQMVRDEEKFHRLVKKGYFMDVRKNADVRPQAIILNPERRRYSDGRKGLQLNIDDDLPEFFGMYCGQTMGRELLLLTENGAEFLSQYKDRFIREYSGWNRKHAGNDGQDCETSLVGDRS